MSTDKNQPDPNVIRLNNVRLSYPALFEKRPGPNGGKAKFQASFILDKKVNAKEIAAINAVIARLVKEEFGGNAKVLKGTCLRDGSEKGDTDGYGDGVMFIGSSTDNRPGVVDQRLNPLTAEDGRPYAGCYVNATIRLWAQNGKSNKMDASFGKRINASLRNVQFLKDGEPFGAATTPPEEEFEAVEESVDDPV